ncbi:DUF3221 domain-containing protein [Sporosarcina sp. HYO08]|uniref:DUF3221 domain-containing protein n=1 Tax=Sporosarcina sp. HYO08 TaxID=1759557 RepID=UPI000796B118|nr:DUF3221 domain-containing protein [Sporosarcina sp. HYO08]KXH84090.1 hypothetical protein AU377_04890 [Sporosarcina sp. HYO08]
MVTKKINLLFLGFVLILSACGTLEAFENSSTPTHQVEIATITGSDGSQWDVLKTIEDRSIIAELKQTTDNTTIRDKKAAEISEGDDFKDSMFGEPTTDLAEKLAIQGIELNAAVEAVERVYGGYEGFEKEGVYFLEWKSDGAKQSGFWIGIKNLDERLIELVGILQKQVDNGEILAKNIYFYHSSFTQKENNDLMREVYNTTRKMADNHEKPNIAGAGVSVNTITGIIEINHNFLTEEQKNDLRQQFPSYEIKFEQTGRLVPIGDEPDVLYPSTKFTKVPSTEGNYVIRVMENEMLITGAAYVTFQDANKKVKVGQRVLVEFAGSVEFSYPGRGTAKIVEVLPEYKPANSKLSESQVAQKAFKQAEARSTWVPSIKSMNFDEQAKSWKVTMVQDEGEYNLMIKDE